MTKAQGSFLGRGITIVSGSAHSLYLSSQTLKHDAPSGPSVSQKRRWEIPARALPRLVAFRPLEGRCGGANLGSSSLLSP